MSESESPTKTTEDLAETVSQMDLNIGKPHEIQKVQKDKIDILLKPTGSAPIMKKKKWAVERDKKIGSIIEFIKKYLKMEPSDSLFLYVNQSFAPSPDQIVQNLYDCYETDGKLIMYYCISQAWG